MTLEERIGQLLVFGWMGDSSQELCSVNGRARRLIAEQKVGGVILMSRNVQTPEQVSTLTDDLQSLVGDYGLPPLLICIDQEGGPNTRLIPPHFRRSREMWDIGATGDVREARAEASAIGRELAAMGINWDMAPVLDVNNNPANPIIGHRSFSDDPAVVSAMVVEAIRGLQSDAGVMACGKHFPGHGDTAVDSHESLPVIKHPLSRLDAVELAPFRAAIDAGIASIMTAHILFPAIDSVLPATLSRPILTDLLRGKLGFDGVVVTDCLEMRGVCEKWRPGDAAVLAVEAGADVILCCHTPEVQQEIRDNLILAVQSGRISEPRIDESLARLARAKSRWANRRPAQVVSAV